MEQAIQTSAVAQHATQCTVHGFGPFGVSLSKLQNAQSRELKINYENTEARYRTPRLPIFRPMRRIVSVSQKTEDKTFLARDSIRNLTGLDSGLKCAGAACGVFGNRRRRHRALHDYARGTDGDLPRRVVVVEPESSSILV
ncbi:hypothetical protein M513_09460 [Trichuris suis]|uniref:Uncharacterized protein n=1 Tax=Trichuris suis TaxID=68888 RepID=A0A085LXD2_9BILA|nr:hypothetical protein M513_09460 [Trichuris suis]